MVIPGWMCADRGFDWQPLARIAHSSSLVEGFWFVYLASVAPLGPLILFTTPSMTCSAAASTLLHVQRKTRLEFPPPDMLPEGAVCPSSPSLSCK